MNYCTIADVITVAYDLRDSFYDSNTEDVGTTIIESAIADASSIVRQTITRMYDIDTIEAMSPLPITVINAAKIYAAILLYRRQGPYSDNVDREKKLMTEYNTYLMPIQMGTMLDSLNNFIATNQSLSGILQSAGTLTNAIGALYNDGDRRYR